MEAFAEVVRVTDFGAVSDGVRVEDGEVGNGAGLDASAFGDLEGLGGEACHFADGFFEEEGTVIADEFSEDAGVVPEAARVGHGFAESARASVAGDHGHAVGEEGGHVGVVHVLEDAASSSIGFDVEEELGLVFEGIRAEFCLGGFGDCFALEGGIGVVFGDDGVGVIFSTEAFAHVCHFLEDGLALFGVGDALAEGVSAAFAGGIGEELGEAGAGVGIGVAVVGDLQALVSG